MKYRHLFISLCLLIISLFMICSCDGQSNNGEIGDAGGHNSGNNNGDFDSPGSAFEKHKVVFDYNDGSGQKTEVLIPHGSTINGYAPSLDFEDREVVGWSTRTEGADFTASVTENTTLYAQWIIYTPAVYSDNIPAMVTDRVVEIHASTMMSGKTLRVGPSVQKLSVISDGSISHDFSIIINERNSDIAVLFDNFSFVSNQNFGLQAAGETADYTVFLTVKNDCMIDCSSVSASHSSPGATCISAPNLNINGNGRLTLRAGHGWTAPDKPTAADGNDGEHADAGTMGGNGILASGRVQVENLTLSIQAGNGGNGGRGGNGNNAPGGWFAGLVGGTGKNGGRGGNGGAGGEAISASSFEASNATLNFTAGNGGIGGNGGKAGGSNVTTTGNGGDGGNGGHGGNVFGNRMGNYTEVGCICSFVPGNGAEGGNGGGAKDVVDVLNGSKGAKGADGLINAD